MTQKYMTTTRIVLPRNRVFPRNRVLYVTSQIATAAKEHLMRLNQMLHPRKNHSEALELLLCELAKERPLEFANGSLELLNLPHLKHYKQPPQTQYPKPWLLDNAAE